MKYTFTFILFLFAINASAQELNKKIEDPTRHKQIMLNNCTREGIVNFPEFNENYESFYEGYQLDSMSLKAITKSLKDKKITVVLGTWCGDSKLQVPHFLKVLDAVKFDESKVSFICVDGMKKAENGLIDNLNITNVPTFIFSDKNGKELGRITEHPKETIEKDIIKILNTKQETTKSK